MKIRLLLFAVAVLMLIQVVVLFSQDNPLEPVQTGSTILIGPVIGYNDLNHKTDNLATFASDAYCPSFTGGKGKGFFAGLTYEYPFGAPEETISSIIGRVIYSTYPGTMTVSGDEFPSLVRDIQNPSQVQIVRSVTKHTVEIDYSVLAIEIMYKQNFLKSIPLGISVGPSFEIPISKKILQEYSIVKPDNIQFATAEGFEYSPDHRTVIVKDGEIDNAAGFRFGIKFGLQYEIIPAEGYFIVPAVYYNYGLTNVKSDEDYIIHAFQIAIDIRFPVKF